MDRTSDGSSIYINQTGSKVGVIAGNNKSYSGNFGVDILFAH